MNPPPLQLGRYQFTDVSIFSQRNAKEEERHLVDTNVLATIHRRTPDNARQWVVFVNVELKAKGDATPAYFGKVEAFGFVTVIDTWPEQEIEKLVFVNGGGMIYAAIREMICSITSRCVYDSFTIPSHSFIELFKEWQAALEASKKQPELIPQTQTTA